MSLKGLSLRIRPVSFEEPIKSSEIGFGLERVHLQVQAKSPDAD